jgi:hypothetical protein
MFLTSSWRSGAPMESAQPPTMLETFTVWKLSNASIQ